MTPPKITVVVPTYNRPNMLQLSMDSILAQDFDDFGVIVLDNTSTDATPQLVQSYMDRDKRVSYVRNPKNIGIMRNWNRCFEVNPSKYLSIFHDDDIMLPGFLSATVAALEQNPSAAFVLVQVEYIDQDSNLIGPQDVGDLPDGLMSGLDMLELGVDGRHAGLFPPTIVMRASAAAEAGPIDTPHTNCQFDLNMYNRMAAKHDVFFIRKILAQYRQHLGSETQRQKRDANVTGWFGECAERIDAATILLESPRAADPAYRQWLARRIRYLHKQQSASVHAVVPDIFHNWQTRCEMFEEQLQKIIPQKQPFILIDDGALGLGPVWQNRRVVPFLERDGQYFGQPDNDEQAVAELQHAVRQGVNWVAVAWPSFWWLDQYWRMHRYLQQNAVRSFDTPNLYAFELPAQR